MVKPFPDVPPYPPASLDPIPWSRMPNPDEPDPALISYLQAFRPLMVAEPLPDIPPCSSAPIAAPPEAPLPQEVECEMECHWSNCPHVPPTSVAPAPRESWREASKEDALFDTIGWDMYEFAMPLWWIIRLLSLPLWCMGWAIRWVHGKGWFSQDDSAD